MCNSNKKDGASIVRDMAKLAQLEIPEKDIERYSMKIGSILKHIEELDELDTDGIEPTSHMSEKGSALRADLVVPSNLSEKIVDCAPEHDGRFFKVPKVLDAE